MAEMIEEDKLLAQVERNVQKERELEQRLEECRRLNRENRQMPAEQAPAAEAGSRSGDRPGDIQAKLEESIREKEERIRILSAELRQEKEELRKLTGGEPPPHAGRGVAENDDDDDTQIRGNIHLLQERELQNDTEEGENEEQEDYFVREMREAFNLCKGVHPKTYGSTMRRALCKLIPSIPEKGVNGIEGLEIKFTMTGEKSVFNFNQICLDNIAHLYFAFDTADNELYVFYLTHEDMVSVLPGASNRHHVTQSTAATVTAENITADHKYSMKLKPGQPGAWGYLVDNHRINPGDVFGTLQNEGFLQ